MIWSEDEFSSYSIQEHSEDLLRISRLKFFYELVCWNAGSLCARRYCSLDLAQGLATCTW